MKRTLLYILICFCITLTACNNKNDKTIQNDIVIDHYKKIANNKEAQLDKEAVTIESTEEQSDDVSEITEVNKEPPVIYITWDDVSANSVSENHRVEKDQFDYCDDVPELVQHTIFGNSLRDNRIIQMDDLRYLQFKYNDVNGELKIGEMVCNKEIAYDILDIFYELYNI